jgi:hypothetical protein
MNHKKRIAYAKAKYNGEYWLGYNLCFRQFRAGIEREAWRKATTIHRSDLRQSKFGQKTEADPDESYWFLSWDFIKKYSLDSRERKRMERNWGKRCEAYNPDCVSCVAWAYAIEFRKVTTPRRADVLYPMCWVDTENK